MQEEVVAKLSGHRPIATGVTISDRYRPMNRARAQVYLEEELSALGYEVRRQHFDGGTNLITKLDGPTEASFVVGVHYDSRMDSPGAIRNATGVAALLASARYLKEQRCRRRDIIFALFDQDYISQGGSRVFARSILSERAEVLGAILLDELGVDNDGDQGLETHLSNHALRALLDDALERHNLDNPVAETERSGLGHQVFAVLGIPGMTLTQEIVEGDAQHPLAHDPFSMVDFGYLEASTAVLNALLSDLSTRAHSEIE